MFLSRAISGENIRKSVYSESHINKLSDLVQPEHIMFPQKSKKAKGEGPFQCTNQGPLA